MIGKTVLVTGAAKRVGCSIARELHASGANIMVHFRSMADAAEALTAEFNSARPRSALCQQADLLNIDALSALVTTTVAHFGRLDALVARHGAESAVHHLAARHSGGQSAWRLPGRGGRWSLSPQHTFSVGLEIVCHHRISRWPDNIFHVLGRSGRALAGWSADVGDWSGYPPSGGFFDGDLFGFVDSRRDPNLELNTRRQAALQTCCTAKIR